MTMQNPIQQQGDKRHLTAYVSREVINQLDHYRRNTPRSRIVEKALREFLARNNITVGAVAVIK